MNAARFILPLLLLLLLACATGSQQTLPGDPEPSRARAALATLQVHNATAERLTILYRHASRGMAEVGVAQVASGGTVVTAPVPAGEPLILVARTAAGTELVLPPRTFDMDAHFTWRIPADAVFAPPVRRGSGS